jgi:group I intron endonuclease
LSNADLCRKNMSDVPPVFSFPEDGKKTPKYNGACIYLICSPNGKPYVGQTKKFRSRMVAHKSNGKLAWIHHAKHQAGKRKNKVCAISFAIHEHGWENMQITILQKYSVWDQQLLDSREQFFIRFYDTFKNGYNCNEGGNRNKGPTKQTEEAKAKMSAAHMGIGAKPVTSREIKEQFDDGTQLVKFDLYAFAREAAEKTGVAYQHISDCCLGKQKSAGNRFWHHTREGDLEGTRRVDNIGDVPRKGHSSHKRAVISTSPTPEHKKQRHQGNNAAARTMSKATGKKFSQGHISNCCQGKRTHHHGYTFCYASDEEAESDSEEAPAASAKKKRKMF